MADNPLEVRPLQDGEEVLAVSIIDSVRGQYGIPLEPGQPKKMEALCAQLRTLGSIWVCEVRGTIVGTVAVKAGGQLPGAWTLLWVYLVPAWRKMGMGRLMVETSLEYARTHGATALETDVPPALRESLAFFKKLWLRPENADIPENAPIHLSRVWSAADTGA